MMLTKNIIQPLGSKTTELWHSVYFFMKHVRRVAQFDPQTDLGLKETAASHFIFLVRK